MTEIYVNSATLILVALLGGIPVTLAAYWGYKAKINSDEARVNSADAKTNSEEAKANSARAQEFGEQAVHELKANGGMLEPNPTLNDKLNFVIEIVQSDNRRLDTVVELLDSHLEHSAKVEAALFETFLFNKNPVTKQ